MPRENRIFVLLLVLIVLVGAVLRFWSLDAQRMSSAELEYHFAARSMAQGAGPQLPSGQMLGRGRPMVALIASLQQSLRDEETAARLPSAVFGTLAVIVFAGVVWLIAGPWAALAATFFFTFYPELIRQSRTAGLYSFQALCGVVALGAGWLATCKSIPQQSSTAADSIRRWIWALLAIVAFGLAGIAHLSAGTVLVGFAVWVVLLAGVAIWVNGVRAILTNLPAQLIVVGLLFAAAILVLKPDIIGLVRDKMSSSSDAVSAAPGSSAFYVEAYASQFGWVFTLFPLLVLITIRKYTWLTIYLTLWFMVPLVEHSLLINRKEERLLLMAAPALFMLAGLALAEAREILTRAINVHGREWLPTYRSAVRAANQIAAIVVLFALVTLPAFALALRVPYEHGALEKASWNSLRTVLNQAANSQSLPLGSTEPLVALQYTGRSDFAVGTNLAVLHARTTKAPAPPRFPPAKDTVFNEALSGTVLAKNLDTLRALYVTYGEVFLAIDYRDMTSTNIDPTIRSALEQNAVELCRNRCGTLRLYRLRVAEQQAAPPPTAPVVPPPSP